jgi:hypothetical protein
MTDGHATLDQLRNGPAGSLIRERRYSTLDGFRMDGAPVRAEYRATAAAMQARFDRFESRLREMDRTLGLTR